MKKVFLLLCFLFFMLSPLAALFELTDPDEILDRMEKAMDYDTAVLSAVLENTDRLGTTSMVFKTWEKGSGDTLLEVTEGSDRGQKILRLEDDIYIYYPDAAEVIRLSGNGLKNSFLGSGFSYEDLTGDDNYRTRYTSELVGTETSDGYACYVVFLKARKNSETYQQERVCIDASLFIPRKFELMSKSGKLLKTMFYTDWLEVDGIYFPGKIRVQDAVKKNNSSLMTITELEFNRPLDESLFDKNELGW